MKNKRKKGFHYFVVLQQMMEVRRLRKKKERQQPLETKQSITENKVSGYSNDINYLKQSDDKIKIIYDINK